MPDRVISVPQATQIATRIKNKFDNVNGRLQELEPENIPVTDSGYFSFTNNTINPTPSTASGYKCMSMECSEGDAFTFSGSSRGVAARLFVFTDSEYNALAYAASGATLENFRRIAPENSTYLFVNNYNNSVTVKKGNGVVEDIREIKETEESFAESLGQLHSAVIITVPSADAISWEQGGIKPNDGTRQTTNARIRTADYVTSDVVNIKVTDSNYRINVFAYSKTDGSYIGVWMGTEFKAYSSSYTINYNEFDMSDAAGYNVKIHLLRTDSSDVSVSDAAYVNVEKFIVNVDKINSDIENMQSTVEGLQESLSLTEKFNSDDFEVSGISPVTGENATSSIRIRTKSYISDQIEKVVGTSAHLLRLYAYDSEGTYIGVWNGSSFVTSDVWFTESTIDKSYGYKYRLSVKNSESESPISNVVARLSYTVPLKSLKDEVDELAERENTDRIFVANDDIAKAANADAVFALYDELATLYPNYITKYTHTSGSLTNYEYVFDSGNYNAVSGERQKDAAVSKPVILITTGVHGNEPAAVMSAYTVFKGLCENRNSISRIRNDFIFKIFPVVVPWGYTNSKRWNEAGVNINRNFDAAWTLQGEPYSNFYSGPSAASEDETKIVQNWIIDNPNAAFLIDFHNSGYTNEVSYLGIVAGQTYSTGARWAYRYGINDVIGHWQKDRGIEGSGIIYGYTGPMQMGGTTQYYAQQTIPSCTFETSNNQNRDGLNSRKTIGVGAEAFAALLIGLTDHYFRLSH